MKRGFLRDASPARSKEPQLSRDQPPSPQATVSHEEQSLRNPPAVAGITGVHAVLDEAGNETLSIVVRDRHGILVSPFVLRWCRFGEVGLAFAEMLYASPVKPSTLGERIRATTIFLDWSTSVNQGEPLTKLSRLDTKLFRHYLAHLETDRSDKGKPHAVATRRIRLGAIRKLMAMLCKSDKWKSKLAPKSTFPGNPWTALKQRSTPRAVLTHVELCEIGQACIKEIEATLSKFQLGNSLIAEGRTKLHDNMHRRLDFMSVDVALAAIEVWMGGYARDLQHATDFRWPLGQALIHHRVRNVFGYLYPDARTMVPFNLLATIHSFYNPAQSLGLEFNQIALHDVFPDQLKVSQPERHNSRADRTVSGDEEERLKTKPGKARAGGKVQHRSFRVDPNDPFSFHSVIENVRMITRRIRQHAPPEIRDRIFIYHQHCPPGVSAFGTAKNGIGGDALWVHSLRRFIKDNKLVKFSLASIRSTMADLTEEVTGDSRVTQLLLGQTGPDVGFQHYFSAGARRRAGESVALAQEMRQRYVDTGGRRDIRGQGPGDTLMSATPGLDCLDPYDSPMPGQTKGKMCTAFPFCIICPLATARRNDPYSFARLVQLETHIKSSESSVSASRFVALYMPLLPEFPRWLGKFTGSARKGALKISYLRPLPELE